VQAYPQAPAQTEMYVEIPKGCGIHGHDSQQHVLKLINNIYGQRQAGKVWNDFLIEGLTKKVGFVQSRHDPNLLWKGQYMIIIYTDDTIITYPDETGIDNIISQISKHFKITSADSVTDFLGVHIDRDIDGNTIRMTQPVLIQSIIRDVGLNDNSNGRDTPTYTTITMTTGQHSKPHQEKWSYRGVIGKLDYLEKSTRPDIVRRSSMREIYATTN
jgi:Reverse transcriptase (RNA-dependent DNA polymerase)